MTSAPFSPNLRFCVVWLCGLEITPKTSPWTLTFKVQHGPNSSFESETGNKASGMAPARTLERMNIKSQEAFWFITAFYEYVCRDVKPHRAVSFFLFFFCTSIVWVLRGSALPSVWKSFFMTWEETLTRFLLQICVYAICTRCCTSSAQNFEFTHWWYTADPLLLPSNLCFLTASQQTKKRFMDSFETT